MACINSDGTLSSTAQSVLQACQAPATLNQIARMTDLPVYRVRASLRELIEAGLLVESPQGFQVTPAGKDKLA